MALRRAKPIKPYGFENIFEIEREFRFQDYIDGAEHRGISLPQIRRIFQWCQIQCFTWRQLLVKGTVPAPAKEEVTFHDTIKWLIGPGTFERKCAFLELLTDQRQTPVWFVSHVWNGQILEFLECLEAHYHVRDIGTHFADSPYWVCAFAFRKHAHDQEFKAGPEKFGFYEAIHLSKGMILILGDDDSINPFTRTWCSLELSVAADSVQKRGASMLLDVAIQHNSKTELLTIGMTDRETELEEQKAGTGAWAKECREKHFPLDLLCRGLSFEIEKTETTSPEPEPDEEDLPDAADDEDDEGKRPQVVVVKKTEDYRRDLLNYIAGQSDKNGALTEAPAVSDHESYRDLNKKLRAEFALAAWRSVLLQGPGEVERLGLPAILHADPKREALVLDYFGFEEMGPAEVVSLARGLPPSLSKLELNFSHCSDVDDRGVTALGAALPSGIRILLLDFSHCGQIRDASLEALAKNLPPSLESLRLRFRGGRTLITDLGVQALSEVLPTALHTLELNFAQCEKVGDAGIESLSEKLPPYLRTLHLDFWMCGAINDDGGMEEGGGMQDFSYALGAVQTLETLHLRFTGIHGNFSDKGIQCLSDNLPKGLKVLKLDLIYLDRLGDTGLDALGHHLPATLQTFQLKVEGCDKITDAGVTFLCDKMQHLDLYTLALHFEFCGQITSKGVSDLAERLPSSLRSLSLNFGSCREIKDDGLIALAEKLPDSLQKLHLDLKYCKKVGDMGVAALGKNLPASLLELSLHFGDCELIYDAGIVALAKGLPQALEWLEINLWRCKNVGDTGVLYIAKSLPPSCKVLLLTIDGTKVSPEKRAFCTGIESMRKCRPSTTELLAPPSQPDRRSPNQSQIAWLRRHGPNPREVDEVLSRADPVLEPVSSKFLAKFDISRTFSKSSSMSMSKSLSSPSLHRKRPPVAAQKSLTSALSGAQSHTALARR